MPRLKQYADLMPGVPLQDIWTDIKPMHNLSAERLGYPTQKPEILLERVIESSSKKGDTILDPFCGCGTAIAAAQNLGRKWIGIDITHLAITLIKHRIKKAFGDVKYEVIGEPKDIGGAADLAKNDPYQFQWWALGLVGARPADQKKGADKGIDGRLYFHDDTPNAPTRQIIFSVKAGKTGSAHVRDLRGVIERENAAIGVLLTLQEPTRAMRKEAASAGFHESPQAGVPKKHSRLQIYTVGELLAGTIPDLPRIRDDRAQTFKAAPKAKKRPDKRQKKAF